MVDAAGCLRRVGRVHGECAEKYGGGGGGQGEAEGGVEGEVGGRLPRDAVAPTEKMAIGEEGEEEEEERRGNVKEKQPQCELRCYGLRCRVSA